MTISKHDPDPNVHCQDGIERLLSGVWNVSIAQQGRPLLTVEHDRHALNAAPRAPSAAGKYMGLTGGIGSPSDVSVY